MSPHQSSRSSVFIYPKRLASWICSYESHLHSFLSSKNRLHNLNNYFFRFTSIEDFTKKSINVKLDYSIIIQWKRVLQTSFHSISRKRYVCQTIPHQREKLHHYQHDQNEETNIVIHWNKAEDKRKKQSTQIHGCSYASCLMKHVPVSIKFRNKWRYKMMLFLF